MLASHDGQLISNNWEHINLISHYNRSANQSYIPDMSYSMTLQNHVQHPGRLPPSLGNYRTSYTNQYIRSVQDYERDVQDLLQRSSPLYHRDFIREKMDGETETAFLVEKTDQQSFVTVLVGVVLTGERLETAGHHSYSQLAGIIYTSLLLLKPSDDTCTQMSRTEEILLSSLVSDDRSVTTSSLLCGATNQPLITALALVWAPILLITFISGFIIRDVSVAEQRNTDLILTDNNDNLIIYVCIKQSGAPLKCQ